MSRATFFSVALIAASFLQPVSSVMSAETESTISAASYLAVRLDDLRGNDIPVKDLLEIAVAKAKVAGADKLGFRGVAIANPAIESMKVSMKLADVPFGKALGYIADLTGCVLVEGEGLCVLYPITLPQTQLVSRFFEPSQNALRLLKLAQAKTPDETRARLESFGIVPSESAETVYWASKNLLYAKLPPREMEVLKALLTLLDRGVVVTARSDARPK